MKNIIFLTSLCITLYCIRYSFHIRMPLNISLVRCKCHDACSVKKWHLHISRSELRPSTTVDTRGGKREKRVQSVKNTLKNSRHRPFHLGEWERDRSMEVKQMSRKSGVCFSQRSVQPTVLWPAFLTEILLCLHGTGVNGAFLHLFHPQGFNESQA